MIDLKSLEAQIKSNIIKAELMDVSDAGLCTIKFVGVQIADVPIDMQLISPNSAEAIYLRDWYYVKPSAKRYLNANIGKQVYVYCDHVDVSSLDAKLTNPTVVGLVDQYPVFQLAVHVNSDDSYYTAGRLTTLENAAKTDINPLLTDDYSYIRPQNVFSDAYVYSNNGHEQLVDTFFVTEDSAEAALLKNNTYDDYISGGQQTGTSTTNKTYAYLSINESNFTCTDNIAEFDDKIKSAISLLSIGDKKKLANDLYNYVLRLFTLENVLAEYTDGDYSGTWSFFVYDTGLLSDIRQIDTYHVNLDTLSDSDVENYLSMVLYYLIPSNIFTHLRAVRYGVAYGSSGTAFGLYSSVFDKDIASEVEKYLITDLDGHDYISYYVQNLRPMFGLSVVVSGGTCTATNSNSYGTSSGRFGSKCCDTRYTTEKYHISQKAYSIYYDFVSPYPMLDGTISAYTTISHSVCGILIDTRDGNGGTVETAFLKFDDDVRYLYISRTKDGQNMTVIWIDSNYTIKSFSLPLGFIALIAPFEFYED